MSPLSHHGVQHIRRTDEENGKKMLDVRTVILLSYTIAFLIAIALTIYLVAYFKPPRQWNWYCRLRGWHVEPGKPSTTPASGTMQTSEADNSNENGNPKNMDNANSATSAISELAHTQSPNGPDHRA